MAVKVADTIKPMADFPVAEVQDILAHDDDGNEINLETLLKSMKGTKVVETMEEFNEMDLEGSLKEGILYVILTPRFLYLGSKRISTFCIVVETIDEMPEGFALEQEGLVVFEKNTGLIYYEGVSYGVQLDEETLDKAHVGRAYYSIEDLKKARPDLDLELVTGQDNTMRIVDALNPRELFIDWFGNTTDRSRFGIPDWYGDRINQLMIFKQSDNRAEVTATMNKGIILTRFINGSNIEEWKDSSTGRDIYTDEIILEDNANLLGFDLTFEGAPTYSTYIEVSGDLGNSHEEFSATAYIPAQDPNSMSKTYVRNPMVGKMRLFQGVSYLHQTVRHTTSNPTPSGRTEYYTAQMRFLLKAKNPKNIKTIYVRYNSQVVKVSLSQKYLTSDTVTKLSYVMPYVHDTSQDLGRFIGNDLANGYDSEGMMHGETVTRAKLTIANITDSKPGTLSLVVGGYPPSRYGIVSVEGAVGTRTVPFEDPDTGDYVRISPDWDRDAWSVDVRISKASIPSAYLRDSQLSFYIRMKYMQMRK